jgi:hypothetical protein
MMARKVFRWSGDMLRLHVFGSAHETCHFVRPHAGCWRNWKDRCTFLDLSRHGNRSSAALGMSTPLDVEILVVLFLTCLRLWHGNNGSTTLHLPWSMTSGPWSGPRTCSRTGDGLGSSRSATHGYATLARGSTLLIVLICFESTAPWRAVFSS